MAWTCAHRVFAVETFFKTSESAIATQRAFFAHFALRLNDVVPDRKSILLWVEIFKIAGSLIKRNHPEYFK